MKNRKIAALLLSLMILIASVAASVVSAGAVNYTSDENFDYALNGDGTYSLYRYHGSMTELELPTEFKGKNIVGIMGYCFRYSSVVSVTIPEGYTSVGELAFFGCTSLADVTIPSSVTSFGNMALNGCTSLRSLDLSAATSLSEIPYAFAKGASALASVELPNSVTVIGESAFSGTGLTSIDFPSSLTTIGDSAFSGCNSLSEVFLPASVTSIGADAFAPLTLSVGCLSGSYAESYFIENEAQDLSVGILGDVDGNGDVDINDVTCIQRSNVGLYEIRTKFDIGRSDVNGDRIVQTRDATLIQMKIANIISDFNL